jgi:hypothetical protein
VSGGSFDPTGPSEIIGVMDWKGKMLAVFILGIPPFFPCFYGYANLIAPLWPLAVIVLAVLGVLLVLRGYRGDRQLWRLALEAISVAVLFDVSFITGMGTGVLLREVHCREVCARFEAMIPALEEYRSRHGKYPDDIGQLPGTAGQSADLADVEVYLSPERYLCVVPIEEKFHLFGRFLAYTWGSGEYTWTRKRLYYGL